MSYEPTPYTWIGGLKNQSVEVGQFFTDKSDRFGYMIGDEEVFPAVTSNAFEANRLMDYLKENGFRKLNATEARVIAKEHHLENSIYCSSLQKRTSGAISGTSNMFNY